MKVDPTVYTVISNQNIEELTGDRNSRTGNSFPAIFKAGSGATVYTGTQAALLWNDLLFPASWTARLSAQSNLTAAASQVAAGASTLTSQSTLVAGATKITTGASALTAQSTLTATAGLVVSGATALTAQSTLTSAGTRAPQGASALTAQSTLLSAGTVVRLGVAALTSDSTLTADATVPGGGAIGAVLSATSTLTAAASQGFAAASALTALSTLTAAGVRTPQGASALTAQSTLSAAASVFLATSASLSANTNVFALGGILVQAIATGLSSSTDMQATIKRFARKFYWDSLSHEYEQGRRYSQGHSWLAHNVGVTLYRKDGQWFERLNAVDYDLVGADRIYRGGRTYELDQTQQSELVAAGYGSGIRVAFEEAN